ncbi:MAG: SsrA-binding protein SmpB [Acidobacteria bacterium]|nr:SsrA-binding protein SmpB [Acidobacteriota bacterium]
MAKDNEGYKVITQNRKAWFNFFIEESYEAGIVLVGTEVKSLRNGKINLSDAYADFKKGELWLINCHISPYTHTFYDNHDPLRRRKLLMKKRELRKLEGKLIERGYTLVPTRVYLKRGLIKVELGLAKGKKMHDKRDAIKKRDTDRDIRADMKGRF